MLGVFLQRRAMRKSVGECIDRHDFPVHWDTKRWEEIDDSSSLWDGKGTNMLRYLRAPGRLAQLVQSTSFTPRVGFESLTAHLPMTCSMQGFCAQSSPECGCKGLQQRVQALFRALHRGK